MSIRSLSMLTGRRLPGVVSAVLGAPGTAVLARKAPPLPATRATRRGVLLDTHVAGAYYYDAERVLDELLEAPESLLDPLDNLRRQWCDEPSVHGGKRTLSSGGES